MHRSAKQSAKALSTASSSASRNCSLDTCVRGGQWLGLGPGPGCQLLLYAASLRGCGATLPPRDQCSYTPGSRSGPDRGRAGGHGFGRFEFGFGPVRVHANCRDASRARTPIDLEQPPLPGILRGRAQRGVVCGEEDLRSATTTKGDHPLCLCLSLSVSVCLCLSLSVFVSLSLCLFAHSPSRPPTPLLLSPLSSLGPTPSRVGPLA